MSTKKGLTGKVVLGTYKVAEMGVYTMSGLVNDILEDTELGDLVRSFDFGLQDGGTISFEGSFDPTDSTGQTLLDSACKNQSKLTNLKLYIDNTSYYTIDTTGVTGASLLLTKCRSVSMEKAGIARVSFEAKVSGRMELV